MEGSIAGAIVRAGQPENFNLKISSVEAYPKVVVLGLASMAHDLAHALHAPQIEKRIHTPNHLQLVVIRLLFCG